MSKQPPNFVYTDQNETCRKCVNHFWKPNLIFWYDHCSKYDYEIPVAKFYKCDDFEGNKDE